MLGVQSNAPGAIGKVKWLFFDGGTPFDAFLTAASAQVCAPACIHGRYPMKVVQGQESLGFRSWTRCIGRWHRKKVGRDGGCLQVGQVILTLPHSLAETNIIAGTFLQLTFATCGRAHLCMERPSARPLPHAPGTQFTL